MLDLQADDEFYHSIEALAEKMTHHQKRLIRLISYYGHVSYWLSVNLLENEYDYRINSKKAAKAWRIIVKLILQTSRQPYERFSRSDQKKQPARSKKTLSG